MTREEKNAKARVYYKTRMAADPEGMRERQRLANQRTKGSEARKLANARYLARHPELARQRRRAWVDKNRERLRPLWAEKARRYRKENVEYRLKENLRARTGRIMRGKIRPGSSVKDLGCTVAEFREYLANKFLPGMSWDNYGIGGWELDHIKPLASFDLTDEIQFKQACHYTNFQPLWYSDNRAKGSRYF